MRSFSVLCLLVLVNLVAAADVVVVSPGGASLKASSDWRAQDVVAQVTNGQRLTKSGAVYGDAVKVKVIQGSRGLTNGSTVWIWSRGFTEATKGKAVVVGKQFVIGGQDAPAGVSAFSDLSWKIDKRLGVLWPGDTVETLEVSITWIGVQGDKWIYAPLVKDVN